MKCVSCYSIICAAFIRMCLCTFCQKMLELIQHWAVKQLLNCKWYNREKTDDLSQFIAEFRVEKFQGKWQIKEKNPGCIWILSTYWPVWPQIIFATVIIVCYILVSFSLYERRIVKRSKSCIWFLFTDKLYLIDWWNPCFVPCRV